MSRSRVLYAGLKPRISESLKIDRVKGTQKLILTAETPKQLLAGLFEFRLATREPVICVLDFELCRCQDTRLPGRLMSGDTRNTSCNAKPEADSKLCTYA